MPCVLRSTTFTAEADPAVAACFLHAAAAEPEQDGSALEAPLAAADDRSAEDPGAAEQLRSLAEERAGCGAQDGSSPACWVAVHSTADVLVRVEERCSAPRWVCHFAQAARRDDLLLDSRMDDCSAPVDSSPDDCSAEHRADHCEPEARTDDSTRAEPACSVPADSPQAALLPDDCLLEASDDRCALAVQTDGCPVDSPDAHSRAVADQGDLSCSTQALLQGDCLAGLAQ